LQPEIRDLIMKLKIAIGTGLLLTLGTAVAGGLFYSSSSTSPAAQAVVAQATDVTPDQLAMWRMTADASSYGAQRVPL
jgi:hypothetical protein